MIKINTLTELDIKYITKLIGRDINDNELRLVEDVLKNDLNKRIYLGVLARLNKGARRIVNSKTEIDDSFQLLLANNIKIFKDKKLIFKDSYFQNLIDPTSTINTYTVFGKKYDESLLKKSNITKSLSDSVHFRSDNNSTDDIIFHSKFSLNDINASKQNDPADLSVQEIEIGGNNKRNQKLLDELITTAKQADWFISARKVYNSSINRTIISELQIYNYGIKIDNQIDIDYLFQDRKNLSIIVISRSGKIKDIMKYCKKNGYVLREIGMIDRDPSFRYELKNEQLINLPLSVFNLQFDVNTKHFEQPTIEDFKTKEIIKNANKSSYSNQLLKLFEKISLNNYNSIKADHIINRYGTEKTLFDRSVSFVSADYNNLIKIAPRMSAKIAVANSARKIACLGKIPKYIQIHNIFPIGNENVYWQASEIMQGQEEAIREMDLTIIKRNISSYGNYWQQYVSILGISNTDINADISFKNDGDFISLLGSHRGELIGTEYQRYINDKVNSVVPYVDLSMEQRLQDVVQQGVSTNLLKSATNVSLGGISIAIAMSLSAGSNGIGAKIHLSRKLRNEELLFGETQGLVIVTLSEEDIMEFERICLTVGVPSTTIGRVTNTNQYTFNDLIKIDADKFRKN